MLGQRTKLQPIWSGPWTVTQVISSVLYRIANRKRSIVAHHDFLKLCSDRNLPIWLLRKRHDLRATLGEDVDDLIMEQATDAHRDLEDHGRSDTSSSSCHQTSVFHLSTHFFAVSLNLLRSSNEQGCARRVHCIMCAVFSVARPHSQVVSPS